MTGSLSALLSVLAFLQAGLVLASEDRRARVSSLTGELIVEAWGLQKKEPLPGLPIPANLYVPRGMARLELDLPAVLFVDDGDQVMLSHTPPDAQGRHGVMVRPGEFSYVQVDCGEASLLVGPGDSLWLRPLSRKRVSAEVREGTVEGYTPSRLLSIAPGEREIFKAGEPGFSGQAPDMSKVTTGRRLIAETEYITLRTPLATIDEMALDPALEAEQRELRMAVGGRPLPAPRPLQETGALGPYSPTAEPIGKPEGIQLDLIGVTLIMVALLALAAHWARRGLI